MRTCTKCKSEKHESCFYKRNSRPSGFSSACKICTDKINKVWRKKYVKTEKGRRNAVLGNRRFRERHPERALASSKKWRDANPKKMKLIAKTRDKYKFRAEYTLRNAVARGKIIRPKVCSECGWCGMIHAHHKDYSKPFDVDWLCSLCHGKRHRDPTIK